MGEFVWNMAISFQLLFIIVSGVIFLYLKEKSFKYYVLYNIFLTIYLFTRRDPIYYLIEGFFSQYLGAEKSELFLDNLLVFDQVLFYNFYTIFALYFLDINKLDKKYFRFVILVLRVTIFLFFGLGILFYFLDKYDVYYGFYTFLYIPVMLGMSIPTIYKTIKFSGKHKNFFLIGVCSFVFFALLAFVGSMRNDDRFGDPIVFFYIGIVIETIFFSLGLAYKIKLLNDEKNEVHNKLLKHQHKKEIQKLTGLLEGEEKERKRIAEELHDGIAGDLAAIKFQLACLDLQKENSDSKKIISAVTEIITKSGEQIRELSHNLSPSAIVNYGLLKALQLYCEKTEKVFHTKMNFSASDVILDLGKTNETHIYRIVQELVNNIVKHSEATSAHIDVVHQEPFLIVKVCDNGRGFTANQTSEGIGLSNINSRVKFLNAQFKKENTELGSSFSLKVNLFNIPKN